MIVVILTVQDRQLSVLLIERAADPFAGSWALPGGLLRDTESLDGAAARKLEDETGVSDLFLEQLYTFDRQGQAEVVCTYFALVNAREARLRADLEWRPAWHRVGELPELAFGNDAIVEYAVLRLRNKLQYANVAYSLLPDAFTMSELQGVYEAILGESVDKRNFRRRIEGLGILRATGHSAKTGAHRPAMLYEFTSREPQPF